MDSMNKEISGIKLKDEHSYKDWTGKDLSFFLTFRLKLSFSETIFWPNPPGFNPWNKRSKKFLFYLNSINFK